MRVEYTVDGTTYKFRTFNQRDHVAVTSKLGLLPGQANAKGVKGDQMAAGLDTVASLLCRCSKGPILTMDDPIDVPEGTVPVTELSDAVFMELWTRLREDSGYDEKAADEIRPSSETPEPS